MTINHIKIYLIRKEKNLKSSGINRIRFKSQPRHQKIKLNITDMKSRMICCFVINEPSKGDVGEQVRSQNKQTM